jgi:thiaminase (transcriptional activator TenA)
LSQGLSFSADLRNSVGELWQAQLNHPFVRGLGEGTLPLVALACWVRQDFRFLIEYCRVLATAAARARDLETLTRFADLLQSTAGVEMALHRGYAGEFGISEADLEAEPMLPANRAYTDFLVRTAAAGDFAELVAALLPCMWGYAEIGRALGAKPRPSDARMARWVAMYADPEFLALADWCCELTDRLGAEVGPSVRGRMQAAFTTSLRYELAFFDMAWEARDSG